MVTGTGKSINLPKGPEVLRSSMAKLISKKFFMLKDELAAKCYLFTAMAFSRIISATGLFSRWLSNHEMMSRYKNALFS
ncbi:hypothetical protein SAMN05421766_103242 [Zobellia uliginosa]|uniref:Uncharacterized protein n=1 Tax=Zobellia uliginosa TaxID=143224 RepID=A0ABY1KUS1_9FLAO|nr:hypothetical protein SAMN05421766_103242 [Zobellia uliginosa]